MLSCASALVLSVVLGALGNSLEPISACCWVYPATMLMAWYRILSITQRSPLATVSGILLIIASQSLAWTVGFYKAFSLDAATFTSVLIVFMMSLLSSTALTVLCFLPSSIISKHFPSASTTPLAFPVTWTATFFLLGLSPISTFANPANALLDYRPIAGLASLAGLHGVNFLLAALSSYIYLHLSPLNVPAPPPQLVPTVSPPSSPVLPPPPHPLPPSPPAFRRHPNVCYLATLLLLSLGSAWLQQRSLYQRPISTEARPTLPASCILSPSPSAPYPSPAATALLSQTAARLAAHDAVILWSEGALLVPTTALEHALLARLQALIHVSPSNTTHLGATYYNQQASRNTYVLFTPQGDIAWRYQKAHPVPFMGDGQPGPPLVPVYDSPGLGLRVAGAICFDMDYPEFIHQAGAKGTDLFLQVSNTWGAVGHRHFSGNALRAAENGMVYFRCSSGGDSGVVTPFYEIVQRRVTLYTGTTTYDIPVYKHVPTLYVAVGWLLPYCCCLLAVVVWGVAAWKVAAGVVPGRRRGGGGARRAEREGERRRLLQSVGDSGVGV